jgi:hypothetical protein
MTTPSGIKFKVITCTRHSDDKWLLTGEVYSTDAARTKEQGAVDAEKKLVRDGFTWPRLGWEVIWMPGFVARESLEYFKQVVPPPRSAWVSSTATDADIAFGERTFTEVGAGAISFSSERMHSVHCLARRLVEMNIHACHLHHSVEQRQLDGEAVSALNGGLSHAVEKEFVECLRGLSKQVDQAINFETDLVRHLNPNVGQVDKLFAFPMSPHCETTHEGMMKVFTDIGKSMQMFDVDDGGRACLHPNAKKRNIHLCVDALSAKMFRHLKLNLSKKLAELSSGQYAEPLIEALEQFTCQHDYLHEHRMHRQDIIYKQFYGCILQAFQAELRYVRCNGEPVKNNLQTHELFLEISFKALKRQRYNRFLRHAGVGSFKRKAGEGELDWAVRVDTTFTEYRSLAENSPDQPTQLCCLLIKLLESYFRCVHAVKKQNFWMCEAENIKWHGAYQVHGKKNYILEGLWRIFILYGPDMENVDLERLRVNRFFLMTAGGNAMSLDDMNEKLNDWLKKCLKSSNFSKNIRDSRFIMTLMKCGYETYGLPSKNRSRHVASQKVNMDKLVALLERTDIFPSDLSMAREFDDEFFWREVMLPKAVGTSKDKMKEEVELPPEMEAFFKNLCEPEDARIEFEEFEDEPEVNADDVCSVVSSCVGSVVGCEIGVDGGDSEDKDDGGVETDCIARTLKQLGNVKRKHRSDTLFKDVLGEAGDDAIHDIKKSFEKIRVREKRKLDLIRICNQHHEHKMQKRNRLLNIKERQSRVGTYAIKDCEWRRKYEEIMVARRTTLYKKNSY